MMLHQQLVTGVIAISFCLIVIANPQVEDKWSRKLLSTDSGKAETFDWVPLAQSVDSPETNDRSATGRVLTYLQAFPPGEHFGSLLKSHLPSVRQQGHNSPYQWQRFQSTAQPQMLRQLQPLKSPIVQPQRPTSQSFFNFEMPFQSEGGQRTANAPTSFQTGYQIQHTFGGGTEASVYNSNLYNQNSIFPTEFNHISPKPQHQSLQQIKPPNQQNIFKESYPLKTTFKEELQPQYQNFESLQVVAPQVFPTSPKPKAIFEIRKPASFQAASSAVLTSQLSSEPSALSSLESSSSQSSNVQQEDVQILYIPYETLYNQQHRPTSPSLSKNNGYNFDKLNFNPSLPAVNPYQINQFYTQDPLTPVEGSFSSSTTTRPYTKTSTMTEKTIFQSFNNQPITKQKPKLKAHQPHLAMFLQQNSPRPTKADVVATLHNANTISVLDVANEQIPQIFVGPYGMPIPNGYVKFDLPYLSQLSQPHDLLNVSFFVAPLSYRTPNGFTKILLPQPHVGSIVINLAKYNFVVQPVKLDLRQQPQQPPHTALYITPKHKDFNSNSFQTSAPRAHTSIQRPRIQDVDPSNSQKKLSETTTMQKVTMPSRGKNFSYFYDQETKEEILSHDHNNKLLSQGVQMEQVVSPYVQFQPMPNQVFANNSLTVYSTRRPTSTSPTRTPTTTMTTTSITVVPTIYQSTTSPQLDLQNDNSSKFPDLTSTFRTPENFVESFTVHSPIATTTDEEYRMKQQFRQQTAFRNRLELQSKTSSPFENVNYNPNVPEYKSSISTPRPSTHKQRLTNFSFTALSATPKTEQPQQTDYIEGLTDIPKDLPNNHRPSFEQSKVLDSIVEYEQNPYQLPSELPPLSENLPGLINGLQDKDKNQANKITSTAEPSYEQKQSISSMNRPNRTRKPVISKVESSVTYSESQSSSKPPVHRIRRPYTSHASASSHSSTLFHDNNSQLTSTTRRPQSSRATIIRNPNRVRYQPTPEERQTLRLKSRKKYNNYSKENDKVNESEDIDYQRDVLKQNYPVLRPSAASRRPTTDTMNRPVETTTDRYTSETQHISSVTTNNVESSSNNNEQTFPAGLLEPMQIAQKYNDHSKDNYGPGYFPNQEDFMPTEPISKNEIYSIYTTTPSTTTTVTIPTAEEPQSISSTTRRSPFMHRNYPRLRVSTTEAPTTTTTVPDDKKSTRPRIPTRKVIRLRTRTPRPTNQTSTTISPHFYVEQHEEVNHKNNNRKFTPNNGNLSEIDPPRRWYKQQFHLDGQESQWFPSLKSTNKTVFKPVSSHDKQIKGMNNLDYEPEIVTANAEHFQANEKPVDTFEIKVSSSLDTTNSLAKVNKNESKLKSEKSFAELLKEVMGKTSNDTTQELEQSTRTTDTIFFESQKTAISNRINRRGKWKKVGASPSSANIGETFDTAESKYLGTQFLNSLYINEQKDANPIAQQQSNNVTFSMPNTTVTSYLPTISSAVITTTSVPQSDIGEQKIKAVHLLDTVTMPTTLSMNLVNEMTQITTTLIPETTVNSPAYHLAEYRKANGEDLDTQPSLFSEVKQQLHELFSFEENEDPALNGALAAVNRHRQENTNMKTNVAGIETEAPFTTEVLLTKSNSETMVKQVPFHKNLIENVVYATEVSTKESSETEICYRGRCIRSEDLPPNHKLT